MMIPRYHPVWLLKQPALQPTARIPSRPKPGLDWWRLVPPVTLRLRSRLLNQEIDCSPGLLERELQLVFPKRGFQSVPTLPCRFYGSPIMWLTAHLLFSVIAFDCQCLYVLSQKRDKCQELSDLEG